MNPEARQVTIGVFDSGVGGLTVLAALRAAMPGHRYVYLGDTARVPYGTKSAAVVRRYALEAAWFLRREQPDALVVACNSASAAALAALRAAHPDLPVFGVVEPGAAAAAARGGRRVLVLATEGTVASQAYPEALRGHRADLEIRQIACPLFVPLAEEGLTDDALADTVARRYLEAVRDWAPEVVVLGCTHYPLLRAPIRRVLGEQVELIDSATPLADDLAARFGSGPARGALAVYVTDGPERFLRIGAPFLNAPVALPERVDLEALVDAERRRTGDDTFLLGAP